MFILDLFRFVESAGKFDRQQLAKFIFKHRECERIARSAGVTPRWIASACSKEFVAMMMSAGYLDGIHCEYWCKGMDKRPFNFSFRCFAGESDRYSWEMMNIEKMSDEELFGKSSCY